MAEHRSWRGFLGCFAVLSLVWACGDGDGANGVPGEAGVPGRSCTVEEQSEGAVKIVCDDGKVVTITPPQEGTQDGGAQSCQVQREVDTISISCPDGTQVSFPVDDGDAGAQDGGSSSACEVTQSDAGDVVVTCPNGGVTIPGASPDAGTSDGAIAQGLIVVGPTRAACGACHDSKAARAHFEAMTVEVDGELQETCGTCHNESSLEPVTRVHERPELGKPGLAISIDSVSINVSRKFVARLTIQDLDGNPVAPGVLSTSFLFAKVPEEMPLSSIGAPDSGVPPTPLAGPYQSYITRNVTQVDTSYYPLDGGTPRVATQPNTERAASGNFSEVSPGVYDYTSTFALPVDYDPDLTHMLALYATRSIDGVTFVANAEKFFVPSNGGATPLMRTTVSDAACNSCHNTLSAHGGSRQHVQLCLGCHTQGAIDPESGNSIDFNVMIHRIHSGKDLPSVKAGTPYRIIGYGSSLHDFGKIGFPQAVTNCETCHDGDERWVNNGVHNACLSCHDDIYNSNRQPRAHPGTLSAQATCGVSTCHADVPNFSNAPDAREAHPSPLFDPNTALFEIDILSVTLASADAAPQVRVRARVGTTGTGAITAVTNPDHLQTLQVFVNGPNQSFVSNGHNILQFAKSALVGLTADNGNPGEFTFSLPQTLRAMVGGLGDPELDSYTLSLRAAYDPTPDSAGTDRVDMKRNPAHEFGAADSVVARAQVVDTDKCNACHGALSAHGGANLAHNVEQCAMCHTASMDTVQRQAANKVAGPTTSLRLSTLVHRIHAGGFATLPYKAYGFTTTPPYPSLDFSDIGFPGVLKDCETCHVSGAYELPLPYATAPSVTVTLDADGGVIGK